MYGAFLLLTQIRQLPFSPPSPPSSRSDPTATVSEDPPSNFFFLRPPPSFSQSHPRVVLMSFRIALLSRLVVYGPFQHNFLFSPCFMGTFHAFPPSSVFGPGPYTFKMLGFPRLFCDFFNVPALSPFSPFNWVAMLTFSLRVWISDSASPLNSSRSNTIVAEMSF